jgi:hypothetical protein
MTDKNNASNEELRFEQTFDFAEPPAPIEVHAYCKRRVKSSQEEWQTARTPRRSIEPRSLAVGDVSDCARPASQVRQSFGSSRLILLFHWRTMGRLPGVAWIQ